ncbi:MAG: hypothetical protein IV106_15470 [Pseudomonas umsongensis]|nr:hypothetical protein [Pseudomonas umsongensis]
MKLSQQQISLHAFTFQCKEAAIEHATDADLIVAPRYEVHEENYFIFKKVSVTVKGNKGNIRSIR